eukprot:CAMPEP_0173204892 /NCGR_PEP_ID=MMETSP1141-20130122/20405_1 /TAXON_ID=483371 /ORGANISM="non described non described, Strain CCMP2298" /LENGTH=65 /DNA_ID=CAMNT_0014130667 /DNA_START=79 /DNA_END=276 /DNA_ORIENTATION=-
MLTQGMKVFLGTTGTFVFAGVTFWGMKAKKDGHNLFDSGRPAAIQEAIDKDEQVRYAAAAAAAKK